LHKIACDRPQGCEDKSRKIVNSGRAKRVF
jgi:hypothetical protein